MLCVVVADESEAACWGIAALDSGSVALQWYRVFRFTIAWQSIATFASDYTTTFA